MPTDWLTGTAMLLSGLVVGFMFVYGMKRRGLSVDSEHDDLAKAALDREDFPEVARQTQYVLQRAPNDARALTYQALVRIAMGQNQEAAQMLTRATQSDPNLLDAWVATAWVRAQGGDSA